MSKVYLASGVRTPIGSFCGPLSPKTAPELGSVALSETLKRGEFSPDQVDEVLMGNVVQAGVGQAPARQAALGAGLSESVSCQTVNKVCGSGLQTIVNANLLVSTGNADLVLAGGMESMSNGPHLLPSSRTGVKFGHAQILDSVQHDGLWDVYSNRPMGNCAEECASDRKLTREEQDEYAITSYKRSQKAQSDGEFAREIAPVTITTRKGDQVISDDDGPGKVNFEKLGSLRPAFEKTGTITAANASTLNDGAASVAVFGDAFRDRAEFEVKGWSRFAHNPTWFTTAPVKSMETLFQKTGFSAKDIDVFEINEAFSLVPLLAIKDLDLDKERVNPWGGAVSLGHPIGCSGTRIVVTLMNFMKSQNLKRGVASICIGGGEGLSLLIERV